MTTGSGYGLKELRTPLEHSQDYVSEILEQVEAIRNLDGAGHSSLDGVGVLTAAVAADHFDVGVLSEPRGERFGAPVRKDVHQSVVLQVHMDSAPATPAPEGEVIHAQDPRRCRAFEIERTDVPQQGVAGDRHAEFVKKPRSGLTSEGERDVGEQPIQHALVRRA
jgi:hypothetical protein